MKNQETKIHGENQIDVNCENFIRFIEIKIPQTDDDQIAKVINLMSDRIKRPCGLPDQKITLLKEAKQMLLKELGDRLARDLLKKGYSLAS